MSALPSHLDERVRADLDDLIALRRLPGSRAGRLVSALVGSGGGGHDRAFLVAANAVHIAGLVFDDKRGAVADRMVAWCLDPDLGRTAGMQARFAGATGVDPRVSIGPDRVTLAGGDDFSLGYGQLADAAALLHFLMVADGLTLFADVRSAFEAVDLSSAGLGESVRALARALSRIAYRYRGEHFPERDFFRRNHALVTFLAGRLTAGTGATIDDGLILEAWLAEVERGERTMFETTARRCLAVETALASRRARGRGSDEVAIEDIIDRLAVAPDVEGGQGESALTGGTGDDGPADWVAGLPESPKVLTGAERDMLLGIVGLHPMHRTRALTVLRSVTFGTVQARLVKQHIAGPLTPARLAPAGSYADEVDNARRLMEHLVNVAVLLVEASRAADDGADTEALPRFKRIRREGFDRPLEEILAALSENRGPIAGLIDELRRYTSIAPRVTSRFTADEALFNDAFRRMYLSEGAEG